MCERTDATSISKAEKVRDRLVEYKINPLIGELEQRREFKYQNRKDYHGGDINKILTEADKSRLIYRMILKIQVRNMVKITTLLVDTGVK